ncbi:hypothetical protein C0580_02540 [Candidatus Parcubacteria bacterium]|nr:MAG: hypothetical protein C0580_02540 [Candidatus Parcubacteria bacterium]
MEWQEVVDRDDIVGGDIECQEGGSIYRGPIKSIRIDDEGMVHFDSDWIAVLDPRGDGWRKHDKTSTFVNGELIKPQDIGDGRVMAMIPTMGPITIFPKGGSKLDSAKVKGLEL